MNFSSLEISETEYLIKLKREEFNLPYIKHLLNRIQAEYRFFCEPFQPAEDMILPGNERRELPQGFDHLDDK